MTRDLFDVKQFMASLADDEELGRELIVAFLEDSPKRMSALTEALEANDAETVSKLAHSLKGMCGVVRADSLSYLALEMEHAARNGKLDVVRGRRAELKDQLERVSAIMNRFLSGD